MAMTAYIFLTLLGGGVLGTLSAARIDLMAWKFVRMASLVALILLVFVTVAFVLRPPDAERSSLFLRYAQGSLLAAAGSAIMVFSLAPALVSLHRLVRWLAGLGAIFSVTSTVLMDRVNGPFVDADSGLLAARAGAHLLTASLLGSVTVAWLLGHAYLTATRMTIAPLRQLSRFFSYAVVLRLVFVIACVVFAYLGADDRVAAQFRSAWMVLFLRGAAGLAAVGVFAFMVQECVKLRNTQAATGLLYFASVLAYVGEISAQYLMNEWRWPM